MSYAKLAHRLTAAFGVRHVAGFVDPGLDFSLTFVMMIHVASTARTVHHGIPAELVKNGGQDLIKKIII